MKKYTLGMFVFICGCASQTQIGEDSYLIKAQGRINQASVSSVLTRAIRDAKETCRSEGYSYMKILDRQTSPGSALAGRPPEAVLEVRYFQDEGEGRMTCD